MQLNDQVGRLSSKLTATLALMDGAGSAAGAAALAAASAAPAAASVTASASAMPARTKVEKMSSEVVDSNPYSRLMALQRMGIVKDYERIRSQTVRSRVWGLWGEGGSDWASSRTI
eukprot:49237-Chlamydomonas_euryale.AAC.1